MLKNDFHFALCNNLIHLDLQHIIKHKLHTHVHACITATFPQLGFMHLLTCSYFYNMSFKGNIKKSKSFNDILMFTLCYMLCALIMALKRKLCRRVIARLLVKTKCILEIGYQIPNLQKQVTAITRDSLCHSLVHCRPTTAPFSALQTVV